MLKTSLDHNKEAALQAALAGVALSPRRRQHLESAGTGRYCNPEHSFPGGTSEVRAKRGMTSSEKRHTRE